MPSLGCKAWSTNTAQGSERGVEEQEIGGDRLGIKGWSSPPSGSEICSSRER